MRFEKILMINPQSIFEICPEKDWPISKDLIINKKKGILIFVLNNEIMKHNIQQGVSQEIANRIMSLKIKIGCCGVKFCQGALDYFLGYNGASS